MCTPAFERTRDGWGSVSRTSPAVAAFSTWNRAWPGRCMHYSGASFCTRTHNSPIRTTVDRDRSVVREPIAVSHTWAMYCPDPSHLDSGSCFVFNSFRPTHEHLSIPQTPHPASISDGISHATVCICIDRLGRQGHPGVPLRARCDSRGECDGCCSCFDAVGHSKSKTLVLHLPPSNGRLLRRNRLAPVLAAQEAGWKGGMSGLETAVVVNATWPECPDMGDTTGALASLNIKYFISGNATTLAEISYMVSITAPCSLATAHKSCLEWSAITESCLKSSSSAGSLDIWYAKQIDIPSSVRQRYQQVCRKEEVGCRLTAAASVHLTIGTELNAMDRTMMALEHLSLFPFYPMNSYPFIARVSSDEPILQDRVQRCRRRTVRQRDRMCATTAWTRKRWNERYAASRCDDEPICLRREFHRCYRIREC